MGAAFDQGSVMRIGPAPGDAAPRQGWPQGPAPQAAGGQPSSGAVAAREVAAGLADSSSSGSVRGAPKQG